jgi:flagellar biogenesis protein FliO
MWIEKLARFGYVAKGFVYGLVGFLAVLAAVNAGGKTTDTKGALTTIASQPFGVFLLSLIAIGLIGYVIWCLVKALKNPENKKLPSRIGSLISGAVYAGLAFNAAALAIGSNTGDRGNTERDWTALVLQQPFGQWLIGIVGALIIGVGFYQFYDAYRTKFRQQLDLRELDRQQQDRIIAISRFGIAARGIVFTIIGFFVIQAARQFNPSQVRGLDGALQSLAQQPFGKILLGIVALGLIAYGVYLLVRAKYSRIKIHDSEVMNYHNLLR